MGKGAGKGARASVPVEVAPAGLQGGRRQPKRGPATLKEIASHDSTDSCWALIDNKVYDVTDFLTSHPGGERAILALVGRDATEAFVAMHPPVLRSRLDRFYLCDVDASYAPSTIATEWRDLVAEQEKLPIFNTDPTYYYKELTKCALILAASLAMVWRCGDAAKATTSMVVVAGLLMGLFWQQIAFVGHDVGHNSVRGIRSSTNYLLGIVVGNVATGVSIGWWKSTHNVHHVVCNSATHDPDIQHLPALCVSPEIFNVYSHYHFRKLVLDSAARLMVMAQWATYYPIMGIARFNLYAQGVGMLINERSKISAYHLACEWLGLAAFVAWYSAVVSVLPTTALRATFVLTATLACALLHDQIALSHWSMPVFKGLPTFGSWFELQLAGTLNIACPAWLDWVHGGLQFQIEHHLFPRMPRHNLRAVKPLVESFARKHNVHYHDISFAAANAEVIGALWDTGNAAKHYKSEKE